MKMRKTMIGSLLFVLLALLSATPMQAQTVLKPPAIVIRDLYRVHNNGRGHLFEAGGKVKMYMFFDKALADLIWKNIHETPDGEVGNLDFDPLYNAQDMKITAFQIGSPSIQGDRATVVVRFKNFGQVEKIEFLMIKRQQLWKISNIDYGSDTDLVKLLSTVN
jgi:hypothetical protein